MNIKKAKELLQEIQEASNRCSLSDECLREYGKSFTTREEIGIGGTYGYGIWMVPEQMVIDIGQALLEEIDRLKAEFSQNL